MGNSHGVCSLYVTSFWAQQQKVVKTPGRESLLSPVGCRGRSRVCPPKRAPTASSVRRVLVCTMRFTVRSGICSMKSDV